MQGAGGVKELREAEAEAAGGAGVSSPAAAWAAEIPESRRRTVRAWLWSVAAMTFGVLVVGGITRLTLSGLSIVEWNPVMGVVPPLTEAQWRAAFDEYLLYPDAAWRRNMTLAEFKFIYFWEYLHRNWGRFMGVVFIVPFAIFWRKGLLKGWLMKRSWAILIGGGLVVLLFGAGLTAGGIAVFNAPGGNTLAAAELTVGLMLSVARKIPEADACAGVIDADA